MSGRRSLVALLGIVLLGMTLPTATLASAPRVILAEDFGSPT